MQGLVRGELDRVKVRGLRRAREEEEEVTHETTLNLNLVLIRLGIKDSEHKNKLEP